jgi:hypothetical protein
VIDERGYILGSTDTIFSTAQISGMSIFEWSDFLESMFDSIKSLKPSDPEIYFQRIETIVNFAVGIYDCTFLKATYENQEAIIWNIFDYSHQYFHIFQHQQAHNEKQLYF